MRAIGIIEIGKEIKMNAYEKAIVNVEEKTDKYEVEVTIWEIFFEDKEDVRPEKHQINKKYGRIVDGAFYVDITMINESFRDPFEEKEIEAENEQEAIDQIAGEEDTGKDEQQEEKGIIGKIKEEHNIDTWEKYGKERHYINDGGKIEKASVYITEDKDDADKYTFYEDEEIIITGSKCYNGAVQERVEEMIEKIK